MEKSRLWRVLEYKDDIYTFHSIEESLLSMGEKIEPTILLFSLTNPAISISYKQNLLKDVDVNLCGDEGVHITRRRTGGRSVYLDEDYYLISIICRPSDLGTKIKNINEAYSKFCRAIAKSLENVTGVEFNIINSNDLVASDGRKIGGVAQRQSSNLILLHSYFRYSKDWPAALRYLMIDGLKLQDHAAEFDSFTTAVSELIPIGKEDFNKRFREAFLNWFHNSYTSNLSMQEFEAVNVWKNKYLDKEWIYGDGNEPSRGNCDLIDGTKLKIKSLEGRVIFV